MSTFALIAVILIDLFFLGGLIVAAVMGLGFYMGWFRLKTGRADGKNYARFTMEENKILNDQKAVVEVVRDLGHAGNGKTAPPADTAKNSATPAV
jgi:hypothetical protein